MMSGYDQEGKWVGGDKEGGGESRNGRDQEGSILISNPHLCHPPRWVCLSDCGEQYGAQHDPEGGEREYSKKGSGTCRNTFTLVPQWCWSSLQRTYDLSEFPLHEHVPAMIDQLRITIHGSFGVLIQLVCSVMLDIMILHACCMHVVVIWHACSIVLCSYEKDLTTAIIIAAK